MVHLTRSTCLFKENVSAKTTVAEKAPSSKKKKKRKKKKEQEVQVGNATDDDNDTSAAVGSPGIEIMRAIVFGFFTFTSVQFNSILI